MGYMLGVFMFETFAPGLPGTHFGKQEKPTNPNAMHIKDHKNKSRKNILCKVWNVVCQVWSVKCKVWSVECKEWSVKV